MSKKDIIEKIIQDAVSKPTSQKQLDEAKQRIAFVEEMLPDDE